VAERAPGAAGGESPAPIARTTAFWLVLGLAAATRLLFFFTSAPWAPSQIAGNLIVGDAVDYQQIAVSFLRGEHPGLVVLERAPLYPLYLTAVYAVFGVQPWVAILLQIPMAVAVCWLLHDLTARWFGRGALAAALLYALEPHAILSAVSLLTDTLYTLLLLAAVHLTLRALDSNRLATWAAAGATLGASVLVRPIGLYLIVPLLGWAAFRHRRQLGRAALVAAVVAASWSAALAPWLISNFTRYDAIGVSTKGGSHLLFWMVGYTEVQRSGRPLAAVWDEFRVAVDSAGGGVAENPFRRSQVMTELAKRYIAAHPLDFAKASLRGVLFTFANLGTAGIARGLGLEARDIDADWHGGASIGARLRSFFASKSPAEHVILVYVAAVLALTYAAAAAGIAFAISERRWAPLAIAAALIFYFLAFVGPISVARYKLPFMPYYLALAGFGLAALGARFAGRRR